MKKNYIILMTLTFIFLITSCVAVENKNLKVPPMKTKEIFLTTDYDKAWKITASVLSEYYPISILDKDSGLITTESKGLSSNDISKVIVCPDFYIYCDAYKEGRARLNVSIIEDQTKKIKIRITPHIELFNSNQKSWKIAEPYPAFYDIIVTEIYRRQPCSVE